MSLKRTVTLTLTCDQPGCRIGVQRSRSNGETRQGESLWETAKARGWTREHDGTHRCPQHSHIRSPRR